MADDVDLEAVAVIGMACRVPGADTPEEFWELLVAGAEPREDVPDEELRRAGLLDRARRDPSYVAVRTSFADPALFDAAFFGMTPKEAAMTDPQQRLLLETAVHALEDAGLDPVTHPGRVGVYLGLNHSDYLLRNVLAHPEVVEHLGWHRVLMGNDRGFTATGVSYRLGLTGPSVAVDCACSSSLAAVHQACRALLDYETDAAVAGGAGVRATDLGYPYVEGGIASPDGRCRPFSAEAHGTVFGSGVGLVVLRRLQDALAADDDILAVIRASDMNNDGARKSSYTAPSPTGQAELVSAVHQLAGVTADQVSYVEAHGTATALGDLIELSALTEAFRETTDATGFCDIGSVKSNIGHLDSASGIAGLIKVVLALRHRTLPPTVGCERPHPNLDLASSPFRLVTRLKPWTSPGPLLAGVSSFGVGGTNVHALVQEPPARATPPPGAAPEHALLPFSAKSPASLETLGVQLSQWAADASPGDVQDAAFTLATARPTYALRSVLLWRADGDPLVLDGGVACEDQARVAVSLGRHESAEVTLRSLWDRFPAFRKEAARLVGPWAAARGKPPHEAFTGSIPQAPVVLTATVIALGCHAVWAEHGVRPRAVVADRECRPAAAVLAGVLASEDLPSVLAALADGVPPVRALREVVLRPASIPWYDADGSELCPAGRVPSPAEAFGDAPATPGRRTLPPRVDAVVDLAPVPAAPAPCGPFPEAPRANAPEGVRYGREALLAGLARAWALGLGVDARRLAPDGRRRSLGLPGYPFDRQRYWLEPRPPEGSARTEHGAAESEGSSATEPDVEEAVRQIFAQALGVPNPAPEDDLFSLGGDSMLATRIVALARARWHRPVPLGAFLRHPSQGTLARLVLSADGEPESSGAVHGDHDLPLTPLQERFVFLSQIAGAAESYNVPVLADLRGPLDTEVLHAALCDVVARHDGLRARVHVSATDAPVQIIAPHVPVEAPVVDLPDEESLRREVAALLDRTIPLDRAPMFAVRIFRTSPERHVLALALHHIGADAHSTGVLLQDLYACYAERARGRAPALAPTDGILAEYVKAHTAWLSSPEAGRQLRYWLDELADPPEPLELPADRPGGTGAGHEGDRLGFTLPQDVSHRVRDLAKEHQATPFTVVLSALFVLLAGICDRDDLVIGMPVSGRHWPGTRDLVGNLVNTLPLRARIGTGEDFRSLLRATASRVTAALDHQDLPFEILARELGRGGGPADPTVFQVLCNMLSLDTSSPEPPADLRAVPLRFDRATSPYPLSLDWWFDRDGAITGRFLYQTRLFDRETIATWSDGFAYLVDVLTRAPDTPLDRVVVEPPAIAARTAATLTGPVVGVPERPVHAIFLDRAAEAPDRVAVTDGRRRLTYGELAGTSAGLAALLGTHGVGAGDPVGIAMHRGVPLVACLLGVLRAGATPVPFDLTHPRRRLAEIAEDCGATVILCEHRTDADFAPRAEAVEVPDVTAVPHRDGATGDDVDLSVGAYLTYTSGTTGRSKGIHFPHRALANLVHWETGGYECGLRWLQLASFGFDAAFHESFSALCAGGSLHIADEETKHDHDALAEFVSAHRIEKAILPVSLLHALAARFENGASAFRSVREIASTGEQLRVSEPVVSFFEALDGCQLINNYGPAETHVVTSYRFSGSPRGWPRHAPIGRPIQNVTLSVLGAGGQPMPQGAVGELVVGGVCVATGYLDRPELTTERFGRRPDGQRTYRTGDRVRLLRSGDVEFRGRGDRQVKIRGFRVELGEIESAIRVDRTIKDVTLVVNGAEGDRRVDAYLVAPGDPDVIARTRDRLRDRLPAAMVPSSFTVIDRLPVNVNGKVDPTRLPAPAGPSSPAPKAPDGTTGDVLTLFRHVLNRPSLGAEEDFFDAGGHSLLATRLIQGIRERLGVPLSVQEFYECGTASAVAALVTDRSALPSAAVAEAAAEELPPAAACVELPPGLSTFLDASSIARQKTFVFDTGQPLDPVRLRDAVQIVLDRYPALRLRVSGRGTATAEPASAAVEALRLPPGADEHNAPEWLHRKAQAEGIDPRSEPLLRVATARLPSGDTLLVLTVHLLALDGLSLVVLCRALTDAYANPAAPAPEADDGFGRYLRWRVGLLGSPRAAKTTALWRTLLPAVPQEADLVRPGPGQAADQRSWAPDAALHRVLLARCAEQRVTPFTLHLTAFAAALASASGREEVCLAVPLDGRPHPSLEGSAGAFANVVPLPLLVAPGASLGRTLETVRATCDRVLGVRTVPYGDLAAADPRLDAFRDLPVVFNYIRDDGGRIRLAERPLRAVGPDAPAPGQRVLFRVVDGPDAFRASTLYRHSPVERDDRQLLALYRDALYRLAFEADATPGSLHGSAPEPATLLERT